MVYRIAGGIYFILVGLTVLPTISVVGVLAFVAGIALLAGV